MRDAKTDARERDAAVTDDEALVAYERKWRKRLASLLRAHPSRWRLPALSDEELVDELMLRLVESVRTKPDERAAGRADREWGFDFLVRERRRMRRAFRLRVVLAPVESGGDFGLGPRSGEETFLDEETASIRARASAEAEARLSRSQRRWLSAMKLSANAGAFFAASGNPNFSEAARLLDKNRSSATRAFEELQSRFIRERKKLEG